MDKNTRENLMELAIHLGRLHNDKGASWAVNAAMQLHTCAASLQRLAVDQCNRQWGEKDYAKRERAKEKAIRLCQDLGLKPITGGDPRGYCLKVIFPGERIHNTLGGAEEGFGIA